MIERLKNIGYAFIMFAGALGFCGLIYWEANQGIAVGSYGGVDIHTALGGFLWVIAIQLRMIVYLINEVYQAVDEAFLRNTSEDQNFAQSTWSLKSGAAAVIGRAFYGVVFLILSAWLLIDLSLLFYPILSPLVFATSKSMMDRFFLPITAICLLGVLVSILIRLYVSELFKEVFPKVPASFRLLVSKSDVR